MHVRGKEVVEFSMDRLEKSRANSSIKYMKAEEKKRNLLDALAKLSLAEKEFDVAENDFEESIMETGLYRAILFENGVCEYMSKLRLSERTVCL